MLFLSLITIKKMSFKHFNIGSKLHIQTEIKVIKVMIPSYL